MNRDTSMTLAFAYQEAADLGGSANAQILGNDHLILGMLCNARDPIYRTLVDLGFTLDGARAAAARFHESDPATPDRHSEYDDARVDDDRGALAAIGIDLNKVAATVKSRFGEDITEGWTMRPAERRERHRGHGGPRGRGNHPHRGGRRGEYMHHGERAGFGDEFDSGRIEFDNMGLWPEAGGRGRRGPRSRYAGWSRFSADAKSAFAYAQEIARAENSSEMTAAYILRGIIRVGDSASSAVIASVTTPDELAAAISASASDDASAD